MPAKILSKKQSLRDKVVKGNADQLPNESAITPLEQNNEGLPDGWTWVRLGDIVKINPKIPNRDVIKDETEVQFLPMKLVEEVIGKIHLIELRKFSEVQKSYTSFIDGDVIFAKVTPCMENGKIAVVDNLKNGIGFGSSEFHVIRPDSILSNKYLFNYIVQNRFRNEAQNEMTGAVGLRRVPKQFIENYQFPLPPLPEQHAIVSKIEELLTELGKGKEQLENAQQQLKIYRQAVLKWAFEGRLTNKDVKEGELPEGWKWVKTIDVIGTINNGYTPTKEFLTQDTGEIPFLKVYNLNFDGTLNFKKNPTFIPNTVHKKDLKRSICYPGDVLINIVGPPLGKVSVVSNQFPEWNINQAIVMFRPNERVTSKYLSYFLQNKVTINWLENTSKATAGQWNIKVSTCREIPFPHCSINEQDLVIQEIESRLSVCDKIEETITTSLLQSETLRQSILKKAFEGKLIPQVELDNVRTLTQSLSVSEDLSVAAEPSIEYEKRNKQVQVSFPRKIEGISTTDLHAGVLAMVIDAHEKSKEHYMKLSHVKGEKIAHLVEAYIGIELGRVPQKDAAGPDDFPHLKKVEHRAKMSNWFGVKNLEIGYTYFSKTGIKNSISKLSQALPEADFRKINDLITTFLPFDLEEAELRATLFAGWNNLLLEGKSPTDEEIVYESRENWSNRKLTIQREKFFSTLAWMRQHGLVATGAGKTVSKAEKKTKTRKKRQS